MNLVLTYWTRLRKTGLCGPVVALLGSLWLLHHLLTSELYSFSGARTGYGPLSWPEFSLIMLIVSTGLICVSRAWTCICKRQVTGIEGKVPEACDNTKAAIGGWLILLYGLGFVFLGFLLSSVLFLIVWMLYGGVRNLLTLATLSVLGTLAPLYLLVKLAYMPLPRGVGVFETATIQIYEWLGIF
jgi:putative tricarboxylic transport membrane protein